MALLKKSEFARLCGVTGKAIYAAIASGSLRLVAHGKFGRIDTEDYLAMQYKAGYGRTTEELDNRRRLKKQGLPVRIQGGLASREEFEDVDQDETSTTNDAADRIAERTSVAKMLRAEEQATEARLKNLKFRGELLSRESVCRLWVYYDRMHAAFIRYGNTGLKDLGERILEAGKIEPSHYTDFMNDIMNIIDTTKVDFGKELDSIEHEHRE